ncbi:hypothetical protein HH212_26885 (plasmid) [Massilia forsythiae]|uniref:Uncharacterized protein n=1 Tax=Massilia forsythiae TaxID=2728020 RepID=A0A7Z2W212_9BURK|nr:hypothetical protein [Massilia forsythiae]QJE03728.1 hypothetical protein HH212_26885 [Massilia forsythiae]
MSYSYEIKPRPAELGGGWKLTLLQDGQEVGGGVFPVIEEDPQTGMDWWNNLAEKQRAHWVMMGASAMPAAARHAYLVSEAYNDAQDEAEAWMSTRAQ